MEPENKKTIEYTMDMGLVNVLGLAGIFPVVIIFLLPFILIWDFETFLTGKDIMLRYFALAYIGGIVVHELLHGLTWGFFASKGMKSIKFGVQWKFLTPYCHCKEPLKVKHYKAGGAMPLIVMGIIPAITGLITGSGALLIFGMFFTWTAVGDIIALFMIRKLDNNTYVSDHPEKMGFIAEAGE